MSNFISAIFIIHFPPRFLLLIASTHSKIIILFKKWIDSIIISLLTYFFPRSDNTLFTSSIGVSNSKEPNDFESSRFKRKKVITPRATTRKTLMNNLFLFGCPGMSINSLESLFLLRKKSKRIITKINTRSTSVLVSNSGIFGRVIRLLAKLKKHILRLLL